MNKQKYDLIVYIGRFEPWHNGHADTIHAATVLSNNTLILIGSASGPRTITNPWTYEEREKIIRDTTHVRHLYIEGLNDTTYNDNAWVKQVGDKVAEVSKQINKRKGYPSDKELKVAVIGHKKDYTSYYLNYFPQWGFVEMAAYPNTKDIINSTKIRQLMFSDNSMFTRGVIPTTTDNSHDENAVTDFVLTPEFLELQKEWNFIEDYKQRWAAAPYAPTFVTVDAIVEQSGHILLIKRGKFPGKGLWAIPGGFIEPTEELEDGVLRELREETKLKVPEKVLRGSITHREVFSKPNRSMRGRTITHAYRFKLDDNTKLPKVKGNDDAVDAKWFSLSEFENMQSVMYEDHWAIIKNMISKA